MGWKRQFATYMHQQRGESLLGTPPLKDKHRDNPAPSDASTWRCLPAPTLDLLKVYHSFKRPTPPLPARNLPLYALKLLFPFKKRKGSVFWEKFLWQKTRLGHFGLQQQVDVYECFLPVWIVEGNHYVCTQLSPKACLLAKWLHYLHTFNQQPALHQVIKKGWTMDYPVYPTQQRQRSQTRGKWDPVTGKMSHHTQNKIPVCGQWSSDRAFTPYCIPNFSFLDPWFISQKTTIGPNRPQNRLNYQFYLELSSSKWVVMG